jgi:hypothetical protein
VRLFYIVQCLNSLNNVHFQDCSKCHTKGKVNCQTCEGHGQIRCFIQLSITWKVLPFRAARWHIFKPKILIWTNFGGTCDRRCWYILRPFGLFYGHLVYFTAIWSILRQFGIVCGHLVYFSYLVYFPPFLVCGTKKNLATLVP